MGLSLDPRGRNCKCTIFLYINAEYVDCFVAYGWLNPMAAAAVDTHTMCGCCCFRDSTASRRRRSYGFKKFTSWWEEAEKAAGYNEEGSL